MAGVARAMRIDVWSDVVCPWCYLGKRRLDLAIADHPRRGELEVYLHSYELDPQAPARDDRPMTELISKKYGISPERAAAGQAELTALAAELGVEYRLDLTRRANTFDAHRLLQLARARDRQEALAERLFAAYFTEGRDIADHAELTSIGVAAGLDAEEAALLLGSTEFGEHVRRDEQAASELGVTGVPFFLFAMKYAVSGAQSPEILRRILDRAFEAESSVAEEAI